MDRPERDLERALEVAYGQANTYAEELRQLYHEQRATRTELDQRIRELEAAQAQLREYARDIAETYRHLQQTYLATLNSLALAVEERDGATGGHCQRVARYADQIAEPFGLSAEDRRALHYGSVLHDIGKIGIPDAVLHKPGTLDAAEWAIMRQHPELGARMVEGVEFLRPALPIILTHHESYDGTGYPQGLRGEEIPLGSRIFQVADTIDAILSDRPYRRGRSLEAAVAEVRRFSGSQFDPDVVAALEQVAPSLRILPPDYGRRDSEGVLDTRVQWPRGGSRGDR